LRFRTVSISLLVLTVAAVAQTIVFVVSGLVALLADLIHNYGDGLTALPLGIAFFLRSARGERWAGLGVVLAIRTHSADQPKQLRYIGIAASRRSAGGSFSRPSHMSPRSCLGSRRNQSASAQSSAGARG
jgi:hypothetical protein